MARSKRNHKYRRYLKDSSVPVSRWTLWRHKKNVIPGNQVRIKRFALIGFTNSTQTEWQKLRQFTSSSRLVQYREWNFRYISTQIVKLFCYKTRQILHSVP